MKPLRLKRQIPQHLQRIALACSCAFAVHAQPLPKPIEGGGAGRGFTQPSPDSVKPNNTPAQGAEKSTNLPSLAPAPKLPSVSAMPMSKTPIDTDSAINPMTGKSFSEERLTRLLNANKLVTDIARQQVAQAQLQTELELTGDRRQAESAKIRSEVINVIPKAMVPTRDSLKAGEELVTGSSRRIASVETANRPPMPTVAQVAEPLVPEKASGSIRIGQDTLQAQSTYLGNPARVVYVDAQPVGARSNATGSNSMPSVPTIANPTNAGNTNPINAPYSPTLIPSPLPR